MVVLQQAEAAQALKLQIRDIRVPLAEMLIRNHNTYQFYSLINEITKLFHVLVAGRVTAQAPVIK